MLNLSCFVGLLFLFSAYFRGHNTHNKHYVLKPFFWLAHDIEERLACLEETDPGLFNIMGRTMAIGTISTIDTIPHLTIRAI